MCTVLTRKEAVDVSTIYLEGYEKALDSQFRVVQNATPGLPRYVLSGNARSGPVAESGDY